MSCEFRSASLILGRYSHCDFELWVSVPNMSVTWPINIIATTFSTYFLVFRTLLAVFLQAQI